MTRIYCAGPWSHKAELKVVADRLRGEGFTVVSRWHDTTHSSNIYEAPTSIMADEAKKDLTDIGNADTLVYMNLDKSEGKATELGMAIIRCMGIHVVGGKQNNVFLHLPQVNHYDTLDQVIEVLSVP